MRRVIVTYDICDKKRLRHVFKCLKSYGEHLQYSVFRCDLAPIRMTRLKISLQGIIHEKEDQVLFIDLGPVGGRAEEAIQSLGRGYTAPERSAFVF